MTFRLNKCNLRHVKHSVVDSEKTSYLHGSCPICGHIIEIHQNFTSLPDDFHFKNLLSDLDEAGEVISCCEGCHGKFRLKIMNPDISGFLKGADKLDYHIDDDNDEKKLEQYKELNYMVDIIDKNHYSRKASR